MTSGAPAGPGTSTAAPPGEDAPDEDAAPGRDFDVFRLRLGHAVAFVAALALLFIMAGDWYSTSEGVRARDVERRQGEYLIGSGVIDEGVAEDARIQAERSERTPWQVSSLLDLLVLLALLATVALAIASAALHAAGRSFEGRRSPIVLTAIAAIVAFVLVVLQAAARLDPDSAAVVQIGLPLGIIALGAIALGAGLAVRADRLASEGGTSAGAGTGTGTSAPDPSPSATYNRAS